MPGLLDDGLTRDVEVIYRPIWGTREQFVVTHTLVRPDRERRTKDRPQP